VIEPAFLIISRSRVKQHPLKTRPEGRRVHRPKGRDRSATDALLRRHADDGLRDRAPARLWTALRRITV